MSDLHRLAPFAHRAWAGPVSWLVAVLAMSAASSAAHSPPGGPQQEHEGTGQARALARVFPIIDDGKVGFMDRTGRVVVPASFAVPSNPPYGWYANSDRMWSASKYRGTPRFSTDFMGEDAQYERWVPRFFDGVATVLGADGFGFVRQDGVVLFPPQFDRVSDYEAGVAWASRMDKHQLVDQFGRTLAGGYDGWKRLETGVFAVDRGGKWGLLTDGGEVLIAPQFDMVRHRKAALVVVRMSDKEGLITTTGDVLIHPQYDRMRILSPRRVAAELDGTWRVLDIHGDPVGNRAWEDVGFEFAEGMLGVQQGGRWGYVDEKGEFAVAPRFESARSFAEGRAAAGWDGKFGFIDRKGTLVIEAVYSDVGDFERGVAIVARRKNDYELIDRQGKSLMDQDLPRCVQVFPWHGDVAVATFERPREDQAARQRRLPMDSYVRGVVHRSGALVLYPEYSEVSIIDSNRFLVWKAGRVRMVDGAGKCVGLCDMSYTWASSVLSEGMRAVAVGEDELVLQHASLSRGRKYGFVNRWGRLAIPPRFDHVEPFDGGLALVNIGGGRSVDGSFFGGRWSYIDAEGKTVWTEGELP